MRFVTLFLTVFAVMAIAEDYSTLGALHSAGETPHGGSDGIVFDQTYVYGNITNGIRLTGDNSYWADDFVLSSDASIQNIRFWIVYNGSPAPSFYDMAITQDSGDSDPSTATAVWNEDAMTITVVDTGDDQWGLDIWEITCSVTAPYPSLTSGQRYWLECHQHPQSTTSDYILMQNAVFGSAFYLSTDAASWTRIDGYGQPLSDVFFELYDTPVALSRATWGNIKAVF